MWSPLRAWVTLKTGLKAGNNPLELVLEALLAFLWGSSEAIKKNKN